MTNLLDSKALTLHCFALHDRIMSELKVHFPICRNLSILLFCLIVTVLFVYLNRVQPYYYIDEVFHIPQTLQYCAGNFTQWDPKITTLPGLYIFTALILSPLNLCSTFCIRCTNLFGTFANLYLLHNVLKEICTKHRKERWNNWMILVTAYNITLFPPLFCWHFLYYTDVLSVNTVLLMLLLHLRKRFKLAAFIGFIAIVVRQTNVIWLVFLTVERALDLLDSKIEKSGPSKRYNSTVHTDTVHLKLLWKQIMGEIYRGPILFGKFVIQMCVDLLPYITVCLMFLAFVICNKGIVVGDRTAHVPTIHVPQFLYFSVFLFGFSWPYSIVHWKKYLDFIRQHWIIGSCVVGILAIVVHSNTLVHPYVLADNRHYVFYFWNKFMGRYILFKYLLIPVYCFALFAMFCNIGHVRFATQINYVLTVALVLVPQLLLEPRYFIIPYIFYRLNFQKPNKWQIAMESLTTLIVNFFQFFIFTNKVFYWEDQAHPQRISW